MPHELTIDEPPGLLRVRYFGTIDGQDLRCAINAVLAIVKEPPARRALVDLRDVDSWCVTTAEFRLMGRELVDRGRRFVQIERSAFPGVRKPGWTVRSKRG